MSKPPKTNKFKEGGDASKEHKLELGTNLKNELHVPQNNAKSQTLEATKKSGEKSSSRPPDLTDSDWELMKWRNPEKYGKPEFAEGEARPDEDKEFVFPRYFHHGAEWKIATHETASHWLTADETYSSKWISTQSITQRPVDRGNLQSRWYEDRLEDVDHKFGVSKHGVPVKVGGQGQPPVASISRLEVWRDPTGKLKEFHKELSPTNVHSRKDHPHTAGSRVSIHSFEDPYYYGDPYVDDPSKYFREKRNFSTTKRKNPIDEESPESSSSEEEEPSSPERTKSPKKKPPLKKKNVPKNKKPQSPLKNKPPLVKKPPPPKTKTPPTKRKPPTLDKDRKPANVRKPRSKAHLPPRKRKPTPSVKPKPRQKPGTKPPWDSNTNPGPPRSLSPIRKRRLPSYLKNRPSGRLHRPPRPPGRGQPSLEKNIPPPGRTEEPRKPLGQTSYRPDIDKEFDYIYFNARRACAIPPNRPVPNYVDDPRGSRHKYCPSGLACLYVNKSDYGKVPVYLKQVNRELGRPEEPDFRKFYGNGRPRCRICGNTRYPRFAYPRCDGGQMGYPPGDGRRLPTPQGGQEDNFKHGPTSRGDGLPSNCMVDDIVEVVRKSSLPVSEAGASGHLFPPSMVPPPPQEYRDDECLSTDGYGRRGESLQSGRNYPSSRIGGNIEGHRRERPQTYNISSSRNSDGRNQSRQESTQNQDRSVCDGYDFSVQHIHRHDYQNQGGIPDNSDFDPDADLC